MQIKLWESESGLAAAAAAPPETVLTIIQLSERSSASNSCPDTCHYTLSYTQQSYTCPSTWLYTCLQSHVPSNNVTAWNRNCLVTLLCHCRSLSGHCQVYRLTAGYQLETRELWELRLTVSSWSWSWSSCPAFQRLERAAASACWYSVLVSLSLASLLYLGLNEKYARTLAETLSI